MKTSLLLIAVLLIFASTGRGQTSCGLPDTRSSDAVDRIAITAIHQLLDTLVRGWGENPDSIRYARSSDAPRLVNALELQFGTPASVILTNCTAKLSASTQNKALLTVEIAGSHIVKYGATIPFFRERRMILPDSLAPGKVPDGQWVNYATQAMGAPSVWSDIIQPTLVLIGGALIVALFFLLRS